MLYFLSLTKRCNLNCKYCGEGDYNKYRIYDRLDSVIEPVFNFLLKDPSPTICFYGGEPLLNIPLLKKVMDTIPQATYLLQTNGLLLHRLKHFYLNKLHTILVSVDGSPDITDYYRGKGTFQTIRSNLRNIKRNGFSGDLIARMTISHKSNIYRDVNFLLALKDPSFDHVHWQLDVIWSELKNWNGFNDWVRTSYNLGITRLVIEWVDYIKNNSKLSGIVPFIGIMKTLLSGAPSELRCGAGIDSFAIQTNGSIYACPVCPEFDDFIIGHVTTDKPEDIYRSLSVISPCPTCEVYSICGGRCLFANHHNFWGDNFSYVCDTVKHLISELKRIQPEIESLINKGVISKADFDYPAINNSCEIIP
jgi:putative peptide-modifying radical SAM enzyme